MTAPGGVEAVTASVKEELQGTQYACTTLRPLAGGTGNFIFRGLLSDPLPDGTGEVVVKHGEGYVASNPGFKIPTSRCRIEEECLTELANLPPLSTPCHVVRTPRLLYFDPDTNTQIQEYLPSSSNLKEYALSHLGGANEPHLKPHCFDLGKALGLWLRSFHDWANHDAQSGLRTKVKQNQPMQALKNLINYGQLLANVDKFPTILKDARAVFEEVKKASEAEMADERTLQVIHGDFWTGNALLPNSPLGEVAQSTIFIIDWELCELGVRPLDLGQMIAELYELYLYKDMEAGRWIIEGFAAGYRLDGDEIAFRTAIHTGVHLIGFGSSAPGWGSEEQIRQVVARGKELILRAWAKDKDWFLASDMACLFQH